MIDAASISFVKLWDSTGAMCVVLDDEPRIDAAVTRWLETGRTVDTLLDLTTLEGARYRVLASEVKCWVVCTPETRRLGVEIEAAMDAERREARQALGIWDDEPEDG